MDMGQGPEEFWAHDWSTLPSWHTGVLTKLEDPRTPSSGGFYGGLIIQTWLIKSLAVGDELQPLSPPQRFRSGPESANFE